MKTIKRESKIIQLGFDVEKAIMGKAKILKPKPKDKFLDKNTSKQKNKKTKGNSPGKRANKMPALVDPPFPPLKWVNMGQLCPISAIEAHTTTQK